VGVSLQPNTCSLACGRCPPFVPTCVVPFLVFLCPSLLREGRLSSTRQVDSVSLGSLGMSVTCCGWEGFSHGSKGDSLRSVDSVRPESLVGLGELVDSIRPGDLAGSEESVAASDRGVSLLGSGLEACSWGLGEDFSLRGTQGVFRSRWVWGVSLLYRSILLDRRALGTFRGTTSGHLRWRVVWLYTHRVSRVGFRRG
jgi:hypothetical protein